MSRASRTRRAMAGLALAGLLAACSSGPSATPVACPSGVPTAEQATEFLAGVEGVAVTTNKGTFTIDLVADTAPIAVANLVRLADCGFYDGISFHRVLAGFVAQAGDPQTRTNRGDFEGLGSGGPSYRFQVEFPSPETTYVHYMVAMANAIQYDFTTGEITSPTDSNGSQFFVMLGDAPALRPYYSVLGMVEEGTEVVDAIGHVPTNGDQGLPLDPVIIESMEVERLPAETP